MVEETVSQATETSGVPAPDLSHLEQDRSRLIHSAESREKDIQARTTARLESEDKELKPLEAQEAKLETETAALQPPKSTVDQVKWEPKPIVDAKDFQQFSWAMLGMALVGGAASRGNWLGVSSSLNGALQGYLNGNQQRADKAYKDYQTQFNAALEHDKAAQKEFEDILQSRTMSINAMLREISNVAAKYNRQDVRLAAEQRSLDAVWRQVEATDRAIGQLEEYHERTGTTLKLGLDRLRQQGGAVGGLNDYGRWFVDQTLAGGNTKFVQMLQSRTGGAIAAQEFNRLGQELQQRGVDPRTLTENQLNDQVQLAVQRQVSQRVAGVERLTGTIQQIEQETQGLVQKVNGQGLTAANATFNKISSQFGDEDLAELKGLLGSMGRQYIEAVTMPGSNAQLHATAQEWADNQFNPDTNLANIQGTIKAMNFEIGATSKELHKQLEQSRQAVTGQGINVPVPGGAALVIPPGATGAAPSGSADVSTLLDKYAPQGAPGAGPATP